ncbi:MAG TPA: hypothetical protein PKD23_06605 [Bellilinea sp.]|jgi:magnesium-transporting ATPase (P-type)|nr:hypothetical protein [Bellilinea sp.]
MEISETTIEVKESGSTIDLYHRPEKLIRISTFANILSWVTLVVSSLIFVYMGVIVVQSLMAGATFTNMFSTVMLAFMILLPGLFLFAALQILGESIFVLMDIEENTRK